MNAGLPRAIIIFALAVAGCSTSSSGGNSASSAKAAVQQFFEDVIHSDWGQAYAMLAMESQKRVNAETFARLGQSYRRELGFEPDSVHISSCDEKENEAIAHITLAGQGKRFKDAVTLRRESNVWRIVLPANFANFKR